MRFGKSMKVTGCTGMSDVDGVRVQLQRELERWRELARSRGDGELGQFIAGFQYALDVLDGVK